jgi:uracil-DNA glycosylase family 4
VAIPSNLTIKNLNRQIISCKKCPRLVEWRETIAKEKTRRFAEWDYWGKPVPGFGDPAAQLWIIGLAPAAHGANRTGRMFTGDRSGDWLYRALFKAGFCNHTNSVGRDDGLALRNCYISALARCAPPGNKPTKEEFTNCHPYLESELEMLKKINVILCLGQLSFNHAIILTNKKGLGHFRPRPKFEHGLNLEIKKDLQLIASYHPSQQNTFTGKLTEEMFNNIFVQINGHLRKHQK